MLQQLRSGAKSTIVKTFLFGLLVLATLGLALFSGNEFSHGGLKNQTVAKIDGEKISSAQFDRDVQQTLHQQKVPVTEALKEGIPQTVLQQEINGRIHTKAAADMGIIIDDATAGRQVKTMLAPLVQKGVPERQALQEFLRAYGLSEGQLVGSIKAQAANDLMMRIITEGVTAPEQMIVDAIQYKYEAREGQYFTLTEADAGKIAAPTADELQTVYGTMKESLMQPETRTFAVVTIDRKLLGGDVKVTDEEARAYFDDNKKIYGGIETRTIKQVVVKDEAEAKALAAAGLASDKKIKVLTGTYKESELPKELADLVFKAAEGAKLEPVKSPLGWHVMEVEKIIAPQGKSFDSVKDAILKKLSQEKSSEAVYARADEIDDKIGGGKSLSDIAKDMDLKETVYTNIKADDAAAVKSPMADKILSSAYALEKGDASQLIETPEGNFMIVETRDIKVAAPKAYDLVKADVEKQWHAQKVAAALDAKAQELMTRLKAGEAFEKVASSAGKSLSKTGLITRAQKTALPARLQSALFAMDNPGEAVTVPGEKNLTVLRLVDRKVQAPAKPLKEDRDALNAILKQSLQRDILSQFRQSLLKKYDVVVHDDVLKKMYAPKTEENQP